MLCVLTTLRSHASPPSPFLRLVQTSLPPPLSEPHATFPSPDPFSPTLRLFTGGDYTFSWTLVFLPQISVAPPGLYFSHLVHFPGQIRPPLMCCYLFLMATFFDPVPPLSTLPHFLSTPSRLQPCSPTCESSSHAFFLHSMMHPISFILIYLFFLLLHLVL